MMTNDVFKSIEGLTGITLFMDDRAIFKKGRNVEHVINEMEQATDIVENGYLNWGFKFLYKAKTNFLLDRK